MTLTFDNAAQTRAKAPAPMPSEHRYGRRGLIRASRLDAIAAWHRGHYEEEVSILHGQLRNVLVCNCPPMIRHILVERVANYPKDRLQRVILARGFEGALLTSSGDDWLNGRRLMAGAFTVQNLLRFSAVMKSQVESFVGGWVQNSEGRISNIADDMARMAFQVMNATLFCGSLEKGADAFFSAITAYSDAQGGKASEPGLRRAFELIKVIVRQRKSQVDSGKPVPDDILTLLLRGSDGERDASAAEVAVCANVLFLVAAGHETTASALTWALYLLFQSADVCAQVRDEAETAAQNNLGPEQWLDAMPMTRAVVEETLRLYPSAPLLSRTALMSETVAGHDVPRGARIIIAPWLLHRHRLLWEAPDQFVPERFLPGARQSIDRFAYIPFGVGPRSCLGGRFAMQEMVIAVSIIARSVDLQYADGEPPMPEQRITLRPRRGMPMYVRPRL